MHKTCEVKAGSESPVKTLSTYKSRTISTSEKNTICLNNSRKLRPVLQYDWKALNSLKSESYAVMEYPTGRLILSYRSKQPLEIASLTKIMTCYLIIKLAEEYQKDITVEKHVIGEHIEESTGTTA